MKKIFTLIATALVAVGAYADEVTLAEYTDGGDGKVVTIADIDAAGGADTDIVTIYVENTSGESRSGWGIGGLCPSSSWSFETGSIYELFGKEGDNFTYEYTVAQIKELAGTDEGIRFRIWNACVITKVTLSPSISYGEGKELTDEDGFIAGSEFAGFSDQAKVVFTYKIEGSVSDYLNWGIGRAGSNDDEGEGPSVVIATFSASALGEQTLTVKMPAINEALAATPEGIYVNFWGFGDGACTASLVKVEVFDVVSTGINAAVAEKAENAPAYNVAGQKVSESHKGIVIKNGKKFIVK